MVFKVSVVPYSLHFFFVLFFVVILLFEMAPEYSMEVLSSFPKCKKPGICLMEKIQAFVKLHAGMISGLGVWLSGRALD